VYIYISNITNTMKQIQNIHSSLRTLSTTIILSWDVMCAIISLGFNTEYRQPKSINGYDIS